MPISEKKNVSIVVLVCVRKPFHFLGPMNSGTRVLLTKGDAKGGNNPALPGLLPLPALGTLRMTDMAASFTQDYFHNLFISCAHGQAAAMQQLTTHLPTRDNMCHSCITSSHPLRSTRKQ